MPAPAAQKNGKRVALIGAGPASLTVARDLLPLGYTVVLYDGDASAGGMMRTQIPKFRLPETVLDEEVDYILDLQPELRLGQKIDSLKSLLAEDYDAIFVGCGAPRGRELEIPGRKEAGANIHIGIDWLSSVSFGHTTSIGKRVIVLGGGNTAMDCCRTSRRLGGEQVNVVVRSGFEEMKASPWEKEDAMHEGIPIHNFLVPKEFLHDERQADRRAVRKSEGRIRRQGPPQPGAVGRAGCDHGMRRCAGGGGPGECLPLDRARHRPGIRQMGHAQWSIPPPCNPPIRKVFFGGDAAFGPKNIIWAVAHGHDAAISIDLLCQGKDVGQRPPPMVNLSSQKMGIHEWSYDNDISNDLRYKVPHAPIEKTLKDVKLEVELGFDIKQAFLEAERCLNCDVQTVFDTPKCIECDACVDICPMDCITFTANGEEERAAPAADRAGAASRPGPLYLRPRSRPGASWPRTKTFACIAGCAPSAAPPAPGTCRNSC